MTQSWSNWHFGLVSSLAISGAIAAFPTCALAQILSPLTPAASVPPTVLPVNSRLIINGNSTDFTELFMQGCPANVRSATSKFVFTRHGGLPPNPREALASDQPLADLGTPIQDKGDNDFLGGMLFDHAPMNVSDHRAFAIPSTSSNPGTPPSQLVEAQGWVMGANGEVALTTQPVNVTPHQPWLTAANCHTPQPAS